MLTGSNEKEFDGKSIGGEKLSKALSELRSQRGILQGQQTKMRNSIVPKAETLGLAELETRLSLLEGYLVNFNRIQTRIESLDPDDNSVERRDSFEEVYVEIKSKFLSIINKKKARPSLTLGDGNLTLPSSILKTKSLPKLKLSRFSGKYSDWPDFISMFNNLVHNDDELNDIDRFQHLRSCLTDAALLSISSLEVTNENYKIALTLLKKRFENKRLIFQEHITEILNLRPVEKNSLQHLRTLSDAVNAHLRALLSLGTKEQIADALLIHIIHNKLDYATQVKWEDEAPCDVLPRWEELATCIEKRCIAWENLDQSRKYSANYRKPDTYCKISNYKKSHMQTKGNTFVASASRNSCTFCKSNDHLIYKCQDFNSLSPVSRFDEAKRLKLCINCLKIGHSVKNCRSGSCRHCTFKHHSLLHMGSSNLQPEEASSNSQMATSTKTQYIPSQENDIINNTFHHGSSLATLARNENKSINKAFKGHVFLATALVQIKASDGTFHPCRALLDSASQLSFVTERLVQLLRLKKTKTNIALSGISNINTTVKYFANITVKSRINHYSTSFDAHILSEITGNQPDRTVYVDEWNIPQNIAESLADPSFNKPQRIDLLIGAALFFELLTIGQIRLGENLPTLQKTLFGWVVSGTALGPLSRASCFTVSSETMEPCTHLDNYIKKFWEIEGSESSKKNLSKEDQDCEEHFIRNLERLQSGRYKVSFPFRENPSVLGNSFDSAMKRFLGLESRLANFPNILADYVNFIKEYIRLGHMKLIKFEDIPPCHYFLPHHCISKPSSSSTKLRVVFDASSKTTTGRSLNDILMIGPVIQDDLYSILLRFRTFRYAITGDITKMYRQVEIADSDSFLQCIIWRDQRKDPLQIFRLTTVTYGTSSASFLATRCLRQLAFDEAAEFPTGSRILLTSFYVDDMLAGADSISDALSIKNEIHQILQRGGFTLRKWCSNSDEVLSTAPDTDLETLVEIDGDNTVKTLGLVWIPATDELRYVHAELGAVKRITKRSVLSTIARLFDPLGLINPVIVKAKILMQELWALGISWDESLPLKLQTEWTRFYNQLSLVNKIRIPRYVVSRSAPIEIHGFADASTKAYGACIYSRQLNHMGNHTVHLLTAKSRVAPLKTITIPRLELCAALLLTELLNRVLPAMRADISKVVCWSDSQIVLAWIASRSNTKQPAFVANRISKIQDLSESFEWRYIDTAHNPADLVSRGLYPAELIDCDRWLKGPAFLNNSEECPAITKSNYTFELATEGLEFENSFTVSKAEDLVETCAYKNSFIRLQNVFGYICRFYRNCKQKDMKDRLSGPLSVAELDFSTKLVIKMVQKLSFPDEYNQLHKGNSIKSNSVLKYLSSFIDNEGLIRVGGRLRNASLDLNAKHQIILPKSHSLTKSIISHYHFKNMHAGSQTLLAIIRTRYWPIGGKNAVKQVIHRCIRCFRFRPKSIEQIMGNLPAERVQPSRPFDCTGIDFCGPFWVTHLIRGRIPVKTYVCLFICFATKAVHLEVVSNLSTEAFLAALRRFIARRGKISRIWSDNATNFVGANNRLKELHSVFTSKDHNATVQEFCRQDGIDWRFIPPRSPHFGGLWEASIKSAKHLLYRVASNSSFTLEELITFACEAEAIINSRPLTPLSNDPNDMESLTPGHFLIGTALNSIPEPDKTNEKINRLTRWQRVSYVKQHFWYRWSQEYLQSLQQRHKWRTAYPNIAVNSMVIIKDDNLPPLKWLLGRILKVHVGEDGFVRVATIKTSTGILKRAVTKLCPLPLEGSDAESCHFHGGEYVETSTQRK